MRYVLIDVLYNINNNNIVATFSLIQILRICSKLLMNTTIGMFIRIYLPRSSTWQVNWLFDTSLWLTLQMMFELPSNLPTYATYQRITPFGSSGSVQLTSALVLDCTLYTSLETGPGTV